MTAPWPPWSWANRDRDRLEQDCWEAREDPREFLPDADLFRRANPRPDPADEEDAWLAMKREDAENRYGRGWEGMGPA